MLGDVICGSYVIPILWEHLSMQLRGDVLTGDEVNLQRVYRLRSLLILLAHKNCAVRHCNYTEE